MGRIGAGVIATLSELAFLPPVRKLQNLRGGILPTGIIKFTNTLSLLLLSFLPKLAISTKRLCLKCSVYSKTHSAPCDSGPPANLSFPCLINSKFNTVDHSFGV